MDKVHLQLANIVSDYLKTLSNEQVTEFLEESRLNDFFDMKEQSPSNEESIIDRIELKHVERSEYYFHLDGKQYLIDLGEPEFPTIFGKMIGNFESFEQLDSSDYHKLYYRDDDGDIRRIAYYKMDDYHFY